MRPGAVPGAHSSFRVRLADAWAWIRVRLVRWRPFWFMGWPQVDRSPEWWAVRRAHLRRHPVCEACGTSRGLHVHHVIPVHLRPDLELDPENLLTLCRAHHRDLGHAGDWWAWVPSARELAVQARSDPHGAAEACRLAIEARRYAA